MFIFYCSRLESIITVILGQAQHLQNHENFTKIEQNLSIKLYFLKLFSRWPPVFLNIILYRKGLPKSSFCIKIAPLNPTLKIKNTFKLSVLPLNPCIFPVFQILFVQNLVGWPPFFMQDYDVSLRREGF